MKGATNNNPKKGINPQNRHQITCQDRIENPSASQCNTSLKKSTVYTQIQQLSSKKSARCNCLNPFKTVPSERTFVGPEDSLDNNKTRNKIKTAATNGIPIACVPKNGFPCDAPCFRNATRSLAIMLNPLMP
jgi:hypothetical protein